MSQSRCGWWWMLCCRVPAEDWSTVSQGGYLLIDSSPSIMNVTEFESRFYDFWANMGQAHSAEISHTHHTSILLVLYCVIFIGFKALCWQRVKYLQSEKDAAKWKIFTKVNQCNWSYIDKQVDKINEFNNKLFAFSILGSLTQFLITLSI